MLSSSMQLRTGGRAVCVMCGSADRCKCRDATSQPLSDGYVSAGQRLRRRPTMVYALRDAQNTYCIQAFFTYRTSYDVRWHYVLIEFHPHRLRNWEFIDGAKKSVTVTEAIFMKLCCWKTFCALLEGGVAPKHAGTCIYI